MSSAVVMSNAGSQANMSGVVLFGLAGVVALAALVGCCLALCCGGRGLTKASRTKGARVFPSEALSAHEEKDPQTLVTDTAFEVVAMAAHVAAGHPGTCYAQGTNCMKTPWKSPATSSGQPTKHRRSVARTVRSTPIQECANTLVEAQSNPRLRPQPLPLVHDTPLVDCPHLSAMLNSPPLWAPPPPWRLNEATSVAVSNNDTVGRSSVAGSGAEGIHHAPAATLVLPEAASGAGEVCLIAQTSNLERQQLPEAPKEPDILAPFRYPLPSQMQIQPSMVEPPPRHHTARTSSNVEQSRPDLAKQRLEALAAFDQLPPPSTVSPPQSQRLVRISSKLERPRPPPPPKDLECSAPFEQPPLLQLPWQPSVIHPARSRSRAATCVSYATGGHRAAGRLQAPAFSQEAAEGWKRAIPAAAKLQPPPSPKLQAPPALDVNVREA